MYSGWWATPKRNIPEYWDSKDVPWVTPKDISKLSNKVLNDAPEYISQLGFDKCATSLLPKGAVLLTSRAPIGNVAIAGRDMCTNQGFKSLVPSDRVDSTYLYYCMLWHSSMLEALGNGATFKEVSKKIVEEFEIPLPPLDEQKRIAAILDKADAIHQKRKQVIALADEFLRSVFLEMFGDPVTNPKGWSRKEIKEGVSRITSGWSAKGDSRPCGQGEVGVLKISAVTSGEFKPKENKFVEKHIIPEGKNLIFPKKGDLLFSRANTRELVAATCIVPKDCDDVFLPDKLWNIELSSEELMPEYFHMLLQDDKFKETLTSQATGSSGSMLNISKQKFETTLAPFAPIDLQMKFKNIYWQLKDNAAKMKNSEDYLIEQFNALSQKAFSGQL